MKKEYTNETVILSSNLKEQFMMSPDDLQNDEGKDKPDAESKSTSETVEEPDLE